MQRPNNKTVRNVGALFIVAAFLYFFYTVFAHSIYLFERFNPIQAEKIYSQSQWQQSQNVAPDKILDEWAVKNEYTGWKNYMDETKSKQQIQIQKEKILKDIQDKGVSDSFLYSYVGYKYVNGANPSMLNPEHPPFAKYLIGESIELFGNEHIIGIIVALLILTLVGIVGFQIHNSIFYSGLSVFLVSIFPLFTDQIIHGPQLELYQLFFFLLLTHFILMGLKKKNLMFYVGAGISFGLLLSTKTLLPHLFLFSAWLVFLLKNRWKEILIIFSVGAIVFCLTYFSFFMQGGTIRSFLGLQKYIVVFYGNAHIPLLEFAGNYLRLIFTGSWKFWDTARSISFYSEWNLLWPILYLLGMYGLKRNWIKHKNSHLLISFIILYNLFVFVVPIFPRYLLLLYVPLIILI